MHGLVTLFLGVIALAIILLVVGLIALHVLVVTLTTIMALVVLMTIVRLAITTIASVASMVVVIFMTAMLMVDAPSQLFGEEILGKPKDKIGNINGFEYMYLSNLKIPYFLYSSSVSIKVISMGTTQPPQNDSHIHNRHIQSV
jgi:hypothetical protein